MPGMFLPPERVAPRVSARISIFLGKGGVGRTTLASAFAVDRAAAGERVLLASIAATDDPTARIQHEAAGVATGGRLELVRIDTRQLLDDLVRRMTRLGAMADLILKHPSYDSLVGIVPGIHQLALFHHLAQLREQNAYDRIILDAPATGHGIHFLEAPDKASRILAGAFRERALVLRDLLRDSEVTDVVIVTIPEEMPVRESVELATKLREQGFPLDNVVVNKWLPRVFSDLRSRAVLSKLNEEPAARDALGRAVAGRSQVDVEEWLRALNHVAAQRAENEHYLREVQQLDVKLSVVPLIPDSALRLPKVAEAMQSFGANVEAEA